MLFWGLVECVGPKAKVFCAYHMGANGQLMATQLLIYIIFSITQGETNLGVSQCGSF
jgi:hypothetical protein